jgi:diguanylate cyclase (GGDEF)-like protein/PAS domain S-box-containing protein
LAAQLMRDRQDSVFLRQIPLFTLATQTMSKSALRQQRHQWIAVAALLGVIGVALSALMLHERTALQERERERLLVDVRVLEQNLDKQLEGTNSALISLRDDLPFLLHVGLQSYGSHSLRALSDAMPGVRTMLILNAQGKVLASSRPELMGIDFSQRASFKVPQSRPALDTLYLSEPFETPDKIHTLNLSKVWLDDKGRFAGLISATLDPEYFQVLLRSVLHADDMHTAIVHGQGQVFMLMPTPAAQLGLDMKAPGAFFATHLASGQSETYRVGPAYANGEMRMGAFHTAQPPAFHMDQPLVVLASRSHDAVLAPWHVLALQCAVAYGVLAALLALGLYLFQRQQNALAKLTQAHARALQEHVDRMVLAVAGADLGLWDMDLITGQRQVNARAQEIVGLSAQDPAEDHATWVSRLHPDDLIAAIELRADHEQGVTDAFIMDYRARHQDGHWVWIHSRGKVTQRDAQGNPTRMIGTYLDITERKLAEVRIEKMAFYDALTKLPNRRLLMDRLKQAQLASARSRKSAALMFLDLDRFKHVNDTMGHGVGDQLLQQVAKRLQQCVRQSDTVARLGGDEFVVLILDLDGDPAEASVQAVLMADKILDALCAPVKLRELEFASTTSIGIALFCGETHSPDVLLKQADDALYSAKADGRNRACLHSQTMDEPVSSTPATAAVAAEAGAAPPDLAELALGDRIY